MNKAKKKQEAIERDRHKLGACASCKMYNGHQQSAVQNDGIVVDCQLGNKVLPRTTIENPGDCIRVRKYVKAMAKPHKA